jgi:hypothetical protein
LRDSLLKPLKEDIDVVETPAAVALGPTEKHDMNPEPLADLAWALIPGLIFQDFPLPLQLLWPNAMEFGIGR